MPTINDLVYAIEANTAGLNQAFPALQKLEKVLGGLDQAVNNLNKRFAASMQGVGSSASRAGKAVEQNTNKIIAAQKRQQAAIISAAQKLTSLNVAISKAGGDTKLITANVMAFKKLEAALSSSSTSAAEATLARAKFNATLSVTRRELQAYNSAQAAAAATQKAAEAQLLKQSNVLEQVRIKYQNLLAQLQATNASKDRINALTTAFQNFEKEMSGSALSAKQFSVSTNKVNAEIANVRRNVGFSKPLKDAFTDVSKAAQVALGPLSGVASRVTAISALTTGSSIAIAGAAGAVVAFGYALYKTIAIGAEFEKQMSRISAVLKSTGNDAVISTQRAEQVVRRVADATGESQANVREAATGLLTISGMNEDLLEKSLKAAEGLALVGGASIQTSFRNLAQVIQEPAQGLQTLTQYGVKFNAVQRQQIMNMVEAGRKSDALDLIFKKLQVDIDLATAQAETLSGAWNKLKNSAQSAGEEIATNSGLTKALTTWMNSSARTLNNVGLGFDYIFDTVRRVTGATAEGSHNIVTYMRAASDFYGQLSNVSGPADKIDQIRKSFEAVKKEIEGARETNMTPQVSLNKIAEAQQALKAGDLDKANQALKESVKAINNVAAAAARQKQAIDEAAQDYVRLSTAHSALINEQQKLENETTNLTDKFDLMKKALMETGKSEKQASAILSRLRTDTELQDSSVNAFLNTQKIAIQQAKTEAQINAASGSAKLRLQTQQDALNGLYESGLITSADYTKALQELADMGFSPLADKVSKAAEELRKYQLAAQLAAETKELQDQVDLAKNAAKFATAGSFAAAQAAAVAAQKQKLLSEGVDETNAEWAKQIALVKQLTEAQQAGELLQQQKELADEVAAAQTAFNAAALSAKDEAMAIALAAKEQELLNENVQVGSKYWNDQLNMVKQLVNLDFASQSAKAIKGFQDQAKVQQKTLDTMFMSERTRDREVALQTEINSLIAKYGSLEDANAQKELQAFKAIQARDDVIKSWQGVADAVDDAFSKSEDTLVDFIKTGKADLASLAASISEDFFRATFKELVEKPLHDLVGKGLNSLLGAATGGTKDMPAMPGLSIPVPLPVIVTNAPGLTDPSTILKDAGITGSGGSDIPGIAKAGAIPGIDTSSLPMAAGIPSVTGKADRLVSDTQKMIQSRIDSAFAPIADGGTKLASGLGATPDYIQSRIDSAFAPIKDAGSKVADSFTSASDAIDKTFNVGGNVQNNPFLSYIAKNEGTLKSGYNTTLGYGKFTNGPQDLTSMNLNQIRDLQRQMLANPANTFNSSALGEYQITGRTLDGLMKKNGLTGSELFTPALQDKFGAQLALMRGPDARGLGNEWASLAGKNPTDVLNQYNAGLPGLQQIANTPISATQPGGAMSAFTSFSSPGMGSNFTSSITPGGSTYDLTSGVSTLSGFGGQGGGIPGLDQLSQSASAASQSMTSLTSTIPQATTALTDNFTKASDAATNLATNGIDQASTSLSSFAGDALQNSAQAAVTTATQTAQMGITSTATAAQVQVLGAAASSAAASMGTGSAAGAVGSLIAHSGGIVGKSVPSTVRTGISFAGAPRLHSGLHPNEFKAILKKGEGVFTEEDMKGIDRTVSRADHQIEMARRMGMGGGGHGVGKVEVHLHGVQDFNSFKRSKAQLNAAAANAAAQAQRKQN